MKSAYEIAMARMEAASGPTRKLTQEEKGRISEIDSKYDAQAAETRLSYEGKIRSAPAIEGAGLREELAKELARIESRREEAKGAVWKGEH